MNQKGQIGLNIDKINQKGSKRPKRFKVQGSKGSGSDCFGSGSGSAPSCEIWFRVKRSKDKKKSILIKKLKN